MTLHTLITHFIIFHITAVVLYYLPTVSLNALKVNSTHYHYFVTCSYISYPFFFLARAIRIHIRLHLLSQKHAALRLHRCKGLLTYIKRNSSHWCSSYFQNEIFMIATFFCLGVILVGFTSGALSYLN